MVAIMKKIAWMIRVACGISFLSAIASLEHFPDSIEAGKALAASAQDALCQIPARIRETAELASRERVRNYRPIFQQCHNAQDQTRLALRRMSVDAENWLLTVDPTTLETSLEQARCWTCTDTDNEAQKATRFIGAVQMGSQQASSGTAIPPSSFNAGLTHGSKDGSFITGDLCPSRKPLDRDLVEVLKGIGPQTPVAFAISGLWLTRHATDFQWLREQARSSALKITWVNHSYHHPYLPGRPEANNYLLMPGFDPQSEILDTERLLIANGETPSIFFRFPGLVSDAALVELVRRDHLVVLGADGWLVFAPPLRPGAILLIHPNGNEHPGLRLFVKLLDKGKLPRPFRSIDEAP